MDNLPSNNDASSHARQALISERRRQFESALRDGHHPPIEGFLNDSQGHDREQLVVGLVAIEVQYRQAAGERPQLDEYIARFPEHESALLAAVAPLLSSDSELSNSTVVGGLIVSSELLTAAHQAPRPTLGRYHLREIIGRGGFGEVWKGYDPLLDRPVAVKTLRDDKELSVSAVHGFISEGRHLAKLKHPAIVSVYDVGVEQGRAFIVSELIDGETLQSQIGHQPVEWKKAASLVEQIAAALQVAHQANIFHRDIKPSNILMDSQGRPHVADFGLAVTEEQQLAESASTLGTYAYMSPEQLKGNSHLIDGRADIYSLGVVLYQLLTGRVPFLAKSVDQYREQVLARPPRPVRQIVENIPETIEQICLKCLRKHPEERYSTAGDLAEALRQVLGSESLPATTVARVPTATVSAMKSPRGRFAVLVVTSALILVAVGWNSLSQRNTRNNSTEGLMSTTPGREGDAVSGGVPGPRALAANEYQPSVLLGERVILQTLDDGRALTVHSPEEGLVKLGEMTDGDLEFEVEITEEGSDFLGIFFGYQQYGEQGENTRYQLALIKNWSDWEHRQFVLAMPYFPTQSRTADELEFGNKFVTPRTALPHSQTISVRILDGRLAEIQLDGEPYDDFIRYWEQRIPPDADCTGAFGFFCNGAGATFRKLIINGRDATIVDPGIDRNEPL